MKKFSLIKAEKKKLSFRIVKTYVKSGRCRFQLIMKLFTLESEAKIYFLSQLDSRFDEICFLFSH